VPPPDVPPVVFAGVAAGVVGAAEPTANVPDGVGSTTVDGLLPQPATATSAHTRADEAARVVRRMPLTVGAK
jgi:hypothetical protein